MKNSKAFFVIFLISSPAFVQDINLSGRVLDEATSMPIEGVSVELAGLELSSTTDADGWYSFSGTSVNAARLAYTGPVIQGGRLSFHIPEKPQRVKVEMFDMQGRKAGPDILRYLHPGEYSLDLNCSGVQSPSTGMYLVRLQIGGSQYFFKGLSFNRESREEVISLTPFKSTIPLAKEAQEPDSLHFMKTGYENAVRRVADFQAQFADVYLTSGIAFEPYFKGSGMITDLSTGQQVSIPLAQRIHVMVFPEGYTQQDLDNGEYDEDLDTWWDEVFVLAVMDYLKEAFIIWKYPAPSNENLTGDGTVDSYFRLPLSGGLMAGSGYDEPAAITWGLMDKFPFPPTEFGSRLLARNMIWSYVLFDPDRGRAGYSGQARSFRDPDNSSQSVNVAMARGHQHEFMHAMAKLADEYYELDHGPLNENSLRQESAYITNVVSSPVCETLPWAHLLPGGEINQDVDSLIGAFGANGRYHPTLKCLLNGQHENAELFGGNGILRTDQRMCNWCREICAFRIYERVMVLPDQDNSWDQWVSSYRMPFYTVIGFDIPDPVPQENSAGAAFFMPCTQEPVL
ncbi:hypothetical protein ACFL5V_06145 [Fibrobacterota bacterium]